MRWKLPRRRPTDKTAEEIAEQRRAAAYAKAHREALSAPLLPEQLAGLPRDPRLTPERLRAIQAAFGERVGREVMGDVREATHDFLVGADGEQPWHD